MSTPVRPTRWPGVLAVVGGALGLYLLVSIAVAVLTGDVVAGAAAGAVASVAGALAFRRWSTGSLAPRAPLPLSKGSGFWAAAVLGLAVCWLLGQTAAVWVERAWGSGSYRASQELQLDSPAWLLAVTALLLAPLGEEALLRGTAYPALRAKWPPWAAAFVTAAVFALLHGNPYQVVLTLPLGLLLAFVYEATRRLWPVVSMHVAFNVAASVVPASLVGRLVEPTMLAVLASSAALVLVYLGGAVSQGDRVLEGRP